MLKEIPCSAEITCDVCGAKGKGSIESFFKSEWAIIPKANAGDFSQIAACRGCLLARRFGERLNIKLYTNRDEAIKRWNEIEGS